MKQFSKGDMRFIFMVGLLLGGLVVFLLSRLL